MRKVLFTAVVYLLFLSLSAPLGALGVWNPVAEKVAKSIAFLEGPEGSCTAFVIDSKRGYVMTAAHCDQKEILVDQTPAKVVAKDPKKDLLVLEVKDLDKPALKLAKDDPKIGDEVASYGYGLGLERPLFRVAHISQNNTYIPEQGIGGPFIMTDTNFVPGQSGGPVVDANGDVVMVVQMGSQLGLGLGMGAETIRSKMGKYFELK